MKYLMRFLVAALLFTALSGCSPATPTDPNPTNGELTLEMINEWLNTSADIGPGTISNAVAIVPISHIDGPRRESDFYAFINFKYKARDFIKYQITFLSCTCRAANVNYWQTMYIELSLPESGNINDSVIRFLSFEKDPSGTYNAGFWGDSLIIPEGTTYTVIRDQYIPFFFNKSVGYMSNINEMLDIPLADYKAGEGRSDLSFDIFSGSSVSTNNLVRAINAVIKYHGTDEFFK
jgi:hypothetical protein